MKRRLLFACCAAFLTGCAAIPTPEMHLSSGRFSLRATRSGKTENVAGRWRLNQTDRTTELTLMTPLYGILARITSGPEGALLERPNKGENGEIRASSAEELMQQHLGFSLPVDMLSAWISGHPWSGEKFEATEGGFEQAGWFVAVKRRKSDSTPALLTVSHPETASHAALSVNLSIE